MQFHTLFTHKRVGSDTVATDTRSGFQRDFDRLIFSSAFRRLQNKTQVFPLPGTAFVHNRLTHSLEVASVGRSLGKITGARIAEQYKGNNEVAYEFYRYELSNVIAAACLAHDIGNPAFGHSGEKAISAYFLENAASQIDGQPLQNYFSPREWQDLGTFEGNANAVRVLTHSFRGRFRGGFGLTYTTMASILKYPCESVAVDKKFKHRKKWGFFQTEQETVKQICTELGMICESEAPLIFSRHPFVYLVEAADDICYSIVDLEDAHRLRILPTSQVADILLETVARLDPTEKIHNKTHGYFKNLSGDANEAIAFLRARVINALTLRAADVFLASAPQLLNGTFNNTLIDVINDDCAALRDIQNISVAKIYRHETVIQIEIAGYNVMSELLQLFVPALLKSDASHKEKNVLRLIPFQYTGFSETSSKYEKVLHALDFISGMTDEYATELYRRLKGIVIPRHG